MSKLVAHFIIFAAKGGAAARVHAAARQIVSKLVAHFIIFAAKGGAAARVHAAARQIVSKLVAQLIKQAAKGVAAYLFIIPECFINFSCIYIILNLLPENDHFFGIKSRLIHIKQIFIFYQKMKG